MNKNDINPQQQLREKIVAYETAKMQVGIQALTPLAVSIPC